MKTLVQTMVRQALAQLTGIQEQAIYATNLTTNYDPETGEVTGHQDTQTLNVVFGDYKRWELNLSPGQVEKNDRKALILPGDLRGIKPTFNDTITRQNGEEWKVVEGGIGLDPAEALYVLQVRRMK